MARHGRYRDFLDLAVCRVAEDDILVEQGAGVVAQVLVKADVDVVILPVLLVYASLVPEDGAAQLVAHLPDGDPEFACLLAVYHHFHGRLALVDVDLQLFDALDILAVDKGPHTLRQIDQRVVILAFQFHVDRVAGRGAHGVFFHGDLHPGVYPLQGLLYLKAEFLGILPFPVLIFPHGQGDLSAVGHFSGRPALGERILGPAPDLGNRGGQQYIAVTAHICIAVDHRVNAVFNGFGDLVRLFNRSPLRVFDIDIDLVRSVVREEFHLGALAGQGGPEGDKRGQEQQEHGAGVPVYVFPAQGALELAFVQVFQASKGYPLKAFRPLFDNVAVEPEHPGGDYHQGPQPTHGPTHEQDE